MKNRGPLIGVLAFALILRVLHLYQSQNSPFFEPLLLDPRYYHDWALRILHGDLGGVFYGLPLYPFFLALVYKIAGPSALAVKWAQLLLGVGTVYLVYRIGERLFDGRAAFWGALLAACYGPLIFHEVILIPEALGVPLYAASFLAALAVFEKPSKRGAAALGFLFGLAALTKAGILLFVVVYLATFFWRGRSPQKLKTAALCLGTLLLTLAPVTAHNVIRGKDLVFLTSHAGFNFYVGNHPGAQGVFSAPEGTGTNVEAQMEDSRALAERAMGRPLRPSEISRYWSARAWEFIRSDPAEFLRLCARKFALFFDAREISDVEDYQFQKHFVDFLRFPWPGFAVLGPLVFLGLALSFGSRQSALLYLWTGGYLLGMAAFFVNARYRLPLLTVFFPAAAFGFWRLVDAWKKSRRKELVIGLAALALGIFISQLRLVGTDFSRDFLNAGDALVERGQPKAAQPFYERALKINPEYAKANLALALCLTRQGRGEEAVGYYRKAIELDPRSSQAWNNLGLWYDQKGDLGEAERHFQKALELKPGSSQAHNNLGMVYGKRGEFEKAEAEIRQSLALNPNSARANTNLAYLAWRRGDRAQAEALWRKALRLDPSFPEALKGLRLLESFDSH